jgi:hypothetical protein
MTRTPLERAVIEDGLSLPAALRSVTLDQVGRLLAALDREITRITQTDPLDTVACLRIAKAYRQLLPLLEMRDPPPEPAAEPAPPQTLAASILAANTEQAPARNGHKTAAP